MHLSRLLPHFQPVLAMVASPFAALGQTASSRQTLSTSLANRSADVTHRDCARLKWTYAPKPDIAAKGVACCDVGSRGLSYDNGKIFLAALDDRMAALAATEIRTTSS